MSVAESGLRLLPSVPDTFWIPEELKKAAALRGANNFHGKRSWAALKLRGWGQFRIDVGLKENNIGVPTGYFVRECVGREMEMIKHMFMPSFRYGTVNLRHEPEERRWFRVFYVTKKWIASKLFTNEWFYINQMPEEDDKEVATSARVFVTLGKMMKSVKESDEETKWLDEQIKIREELVMMRDMDRSEITWKDGGIERCDCGFYKACVCTRCIRCCLQEAGCSLPKHLWRESREERGLEQQQLRKKTGSKKRLREFLKKRDDIAHEGSAQAWFNPFETRHDFNFNFNFKFLDDLAEAFKQKNADVPWREVMKNFGFMCAHLYTGTRTTHLLAVTQFIMSLPLPGEIFADLLAKARGWLCSNAQADTVEGFFVPLLTLAGVVVATLGIGKLPSDKDTMAFITKLSKIGSCIKSLEVVKDYVEPAMEAVVDYIRVQFFGYTSNDMKAWKEYEDFCDEIKELNNSGFEERLKTEKELVIKIDDLLIRGDGLMKMLDQLRVPAMQRSRFNSSYAWISRMRNEAAHCSAGKHIPRVPPTVFHILGTTGVGKSEATSLLNARLLTSLGHTDPNDLWTKVYYRDCSQERFDGYNSGVVGVVVDDFGSRVDSESNPNNDALEAIRMQNSAVWQLPMASLSEKGSTFFRAKYVVWTSNRATFHFKSITNPEAVLRRVTLKFRLRPRPEFAIVRKVGTEVVEMLDRLKVAEAAKTNPDVYSDVWLFDVVDPQEDPTPADSATGGIKILRQDLSFDEMAQMCETALAEAQRIGNAKLEHTARYFEKCVQNRGQAQSCWDWFSRSVADLREDGEVWTHVNMAQVISSQRYGRDHFAQEFSRWLPTRTWERRSQALMPNGELEPLRGHTCFYVKGGPRVQRNFALAYFCAVNVEALAVQLNAEDARNEDAKQNLFGRVLNYYQIDPTSIRVCDEHPEVTWQQWFEMRSNATKFVWSLCEKAVMWLPEGMFNPGAQAFERIVTLAISLVAGVVFYKVGKWFNELCIWLFPALDPVRAEKRGLLNDLRRRAQEEHEPSLALRMAIEKLEDDLGLEQDKRMAKQKVTAEACLEALEKEEKKETEARIGMVCWCGEDVVTCPHVAESHQYLTQGARPKTNLESHQDRTQGIKPRTNIESHQERTPGAKIRNVEAEGNAESTNDQNAVEVAHKVKRNIYGIQVVEGEERYFVGNLLFVVGKIAITNKHILKLIKGKTVRIFNLSCRKGTTLTADQTAEMNVSQSEVAVHGMKDVVAIEMPRHCIVHADLRKFFQTKEDFARFVQPSGVCVLGYGKDAMIQGRYTDKCQAIDRVTFDLIEKDGATTQVRDWYRYGVHSMPGDCGSAVIVHDPSVPRKIIGIHMAGYGSDGYFGVGVAIHQELLKSLINNLPLKNAESSLDGEFALEGNPTDRSFGDFVNYGTAAAISSSMQTVIRPGPVHGMLGEVTTKPAHLRPFMKNGTLVDPLEMARKKADTMNMPVDDKLLKQCSKHYLRLLMDLKKDDRDDRILTWEQAIQGTGEEFYLPIKRNTSPGYGWNSKGKGKEPWLGSGETYITDHPEVIAKRDAMLERIRAGKRASTVFVDTLKDERRPLDRVDAGKTRLFAAGEMVYCLLVRQYFAGFSAHMMRNCIDSEAAVGINVFGQDWSKLANKLSECGPYVVAGDFSNYDGTLCSAILWESYDVVEAFFEKATDEERMIRRALWCDLVNSVHATVPFNGTVPEQLTYLYQWSHSQPSGNPLTVIVNSVYHSIVLRYVFKLCARKYAPHMVGLDNWDKYVRHISYGDDDVTNIHPDIIGWFNQVTMTEAYLTIGMVYTDEAKSEELVEFRKLTEVSFLKRQFRWDPEQARWRCPHSLKVIMEMPQWVKRGANVHELTSTVLEEAAHELAQHPREVFDERMKLFEEARNKIKEYWPCTFLTYDEYAEVDMARIHWKDKMDIRDEREIDALFEELQQGQL